MKMQSSLFLALNFSGDTPPEKLEIIPAGASVVGRDGRAWKNTNPQKVAEASNKRLPLLPIDINHATDLSAPKGGESPAYGWFKNLNAEKDGSVWAEVEWNELGRDALLSKKYRYISPVFNHNAAGEINCVLRAALTNSPNLELLALNSEQDNNQIMEDTMKEQLCAILGLPESATDEEVIAAIKALKEKTALNAAGDGGGIALQVETLRSALNAANEKAAAAEKQIAALNAETFKKEVEGVVDGAIAAGKFTPASRDQCISLCATQEGLDSFKKIVEVTPAIVDGKAQAPASAPPDSQTALNSEEALYAKNAGYTEEQWKKIKEANK